MASFIEALQNEGTISQSEQQAGLEKQRQSLLERAQNVIASVDHEQPRNTRSAYNQQIEDDLESQGIEETPGEKKYLYMLSDIDFLQANGSPVRPEEVTRARTIIRAFEIFSDKYPDLFAEKFVESA